MGQRNEVQQNAVDKIVGGWEDDKKKRLWIEAACGTGKTHIAMQAVERLIREGKGVQRVVLYEPSLRLIEQTVRR